MKLACISILFLFTSVPAFAGWMGHADFTSCPRKYVPETSRSEGPFNSEADCNARVEQVKRDSPMICARYSCVNEGGSGTGSAGTSAAPGHEMDEHIGKAISAGINGQISGSDAVGLVGLGVLGNALLAPSAPPTAQELEAEAAIERARVAAALERQRLAKERSDKMDAEAAGTLGLMAAAPSTASDEDLLKVTPPAQKFDCKESAALADRLEKEGIKKLDINMGKTRKMIKQAEEGKSDADTEAGVLVGEALAGHLADKMKDFASNQKTIVAMEKKLQALTAHGSVSNADKAILEAWIKNGIDGGNAVIDTYKAAVKAKAVNFSEPKNESRKEQILGALAEFNEKFMGDTGAWEVAGEHLSAVLGPAGPAVFKSAVLGIKMTVNRGSKMISENDLNEQKYNLGNMMKTRAEMAQKVKSLRKQIQTKCPHN